MSLRDNLNRAFDEEWNRAPAADTATGDAAPPDAIRIVQGELHRLVETAHELLAARSPRLFRYGGILAHAERLTQSLKLKSGITVPAHAITLEPVTRDWLQLELGRIAPWEKLVVTLKGEKKWIPCDPPGKVAAGVLADRAGWRCRVLNGITEIPILRSDGSVCAAPGYDERSGLYFDPNGRSFPAIADSPGRDDAIAAITRLQDPLRDFPFVDPCHLSAALAMILTAIIRRQLPTAPAFGVSAREAGTGKGLQVDVATMIATGRKSPITPFTDDEAEQRKRITSALLAGHPIINIDNIDAPVDSAALAALITSESWSERILGESRKVEVPSNTLVVMTGNNLVIQGDMTRRVIPIELDAQCERPELRSFDRELLPWVDHHRGQLVADALTVLSAWRKAGRPASNGFIPLGSFEDWSREIAACLIWIGLPDPTDAMTRQRAADPKRARLRRVLSNWYDLFGDAEQTVNAVMQSVEPTPDERPATAELREVFAEITAEARTDRATRTKLGLFIRSNAGRVVTIDDGTGLRFVEAGTIKHAARWTVQHV
jgi:putative DNA primase/helicase